MVELTRKRLAAALHLTLQHVVHERGRQGQILKKMMHRTAAAFGHQHEIKRHCGNDEVPVDLAVELQGLAIGDFVRIVVGDHFRRHGGRGAGRERQTANSQHQRP